MTGRTGLLEACDASYGTCTVRFDDDPEPIDVWGVLLDPIG